jgi:hypothetical protein
MLICYNIGLLVFTRTTSMKDLSGKVILMVEMKDQGRTVRDQLMSIWSILRIYNSLEIKIESLIQDY